MHNPQEATGANTVDLPSEVLNAHSILGVCEGAAHLHVELWVKKQHKVDPAVVSVHVHEEGVLHHQPAPRPAETQLVVADAVQTLDPVAARPLENGPFPDRCGHTLRKVVRTSLIFTDASFVQTVMEISSYNPLGPRSVTKDRAPTERNSS